MDLGDFLSNRVNKATIKSVVQLNIETFISHSSCIEMITFGYMQTGDLLTLFRCQVTMQIHASWLLITGNI